MKKLLPLVSLSLLLASCDGDNKNLLANKWQAVTIHNPTLDSLVAEQIKFIDTIGQNTTPEENLAKYGIASADSMKQLLSAEVELFRKDQKRMIEHTVFEFKKDKIAYINFGGALDSAKWSIDDENNLILDDMALKGAGGGTIKMNIQKLSKDSLVLSYDESGAVSTIHMYKIK